MFVEGETWGMEACLYFDSGTRLERAVPVQIESYSAWNKQLDAVLSTPTGVRVHNYWTGKPDTLLAAHVAACGSPPALRMLPRDDDASARAKFSDLHEWCSGLVIRVGGDGETKDKELLLTTVYTANDDGTRTAIFWGYIITPALTRMVSTMITDGRLALVFDLDETLLVANSSSSLDHKITACRTARGVLAQKLAALAGSGVPDPEAARERLLMSDSAYAKEEELLMVDQDLLKSYSEQDYVRFGGKVVRAVYEPVGGGVTRPVVRTTIAGMQVLLTRIDPKKSETSMILRPRPGWDDLRAFISGENEPRLPNGRPKQRFEVYVCTAADRQYALEVWRLLDTNSLLIPQSERQKRIVSVDTRLFDKSVLETLGINKLRTPSGQRVAKGLIAGLKLLGGGGDVEEDVDPDTHPGVMPLALVIDDRVEVWEPSSQPHVLQVLPWNYYNDEAQRRAGFSNTVATISEAELRRVRAAAVRLRSEAFQSVNVVVKNILDSFQSPAHGAPEAMQVGPEAMAELLPRTLSVPALLRDRRCAALYCVPGVASAVAAAAAVAVVLDPQPPPVPGPSNGPAAFGAQPQRQPSPPLSFGGGVGGDAQAPHGGGPGGGAASTAASARGGSVSGESLRPVDPRAAARAAAAAAAAAAASSAAAGASGADALRPADPRKRPRLAAPTAAAVVGADGAVDGSDGGAAAAGGPKVELRNAALWSLESLTAEPAALLAGGADSAGGAGADSAGAAGANQQQPPGGDAMHGRGRGYGDDSCGPVQATPESPPYSAISAAQAHQQHPYPHQLTQAQPHMPSLVPFAAAAGAMHQPQLAPHLGPPLQPPPVQAPDNASSAAALSQHALLQAVFKTLQAEGGTMETMVALVNNPAELQARVGLEQAKLQAQQQAQQQQAVQKAAPPDQAAHAQPQLSPPPPWRASEQAAVEGSKQQQGAGVAAGAPPPWRVSEQAAVEGSKQPQKHTQPAGAPPPWRASEQATVEGSKQQHGAAGAGGAPGAPPPWRASEQAAVEGSKQQQGAAGAAGAPPPWRASETATVEGGKQQQGAAGAAGAPPPQAAAAAAPAAPHTQQQQGQQQGQQALGAGTGVRMSRKQAKLQQLQAQQLLGLQGQQQQQGQQGQGQQGQQQQGQQGQQQQPMHGAPQQQSLRALGAGLPPPPPVPGGAAGAPGMAPTMSIPAMMQPHTLPPPPPQGARPPLQQNAPNAGCGRGGAAARTAQTIATTYRGARAGKGKNRAALAGGDSTPGGQPPPPPHLQQQQAQQQQQQQPMMLQQFAGMLAGMGPMPGGGSPPHGGMLPHVPPGGHGHGHPMGGGPHPWSTGMGGGLHGPLVPTGAGPGGLSHSGPAGSLSQAGGGNGGGFVPDGVAHIHAMAMAGTLPRHMHDGLVRQLIQAGVPPAMFPPGLQLAAGGGGMMGGGMGGGVSVAVGHGGMHPHAQQQARPQVGQMAMMHQMQAQIQAQMQQQQQQAAQMQQQQQHPGSVGVSVALGGGGARGGGGAPPPPGGQSVLGMPTMPMQQQQQSMGGGGQQQQGFVQGQGLRPASASNLQADLEMQQLQLWGQQQEQQRRAAADAVAMAEGAQMTMGQQQGLKRSSDLNGNGGGAHGQGPAKLARMGVGAHGGAHPAHAGPADGAQQQGLAGAGAGPQQQQPQQPSLKQWLQMAPNQGVGVQVLAGGGAGVVDLFRFVSLLNDVAQRTKRPLVYRESRLDDGKRSWACEVAIGGQRYGPVAARTKKEAKAGVAQQACAALGVTADMEPGELPDALVADITARTPGPSKCGDDAMAALVAEFKPDNVRCDVRTDMHSLAPRYQGELTILGGAIRATGLWEKSKKLAKASAATAAAQLLLSQAPSLRVAAHAYLSDAANARDHARDQQQQQFDLGGGSGDDRPRRRSGADSGSGGGDSESDNTDAGGGGGGERAHARAAPGRPPRGRGPRGGARGRLGRPAPPASTFPPPRHFMSSYLQGLEGELGDSGTVAVGTSGRDAGGGAEGGGGAQAETGGDVITIDDDDDTEEGELPEEDGELPGGGGEEGGAQ